MNASASGPCALLTMISDIKRATLAEDSNPAIARAQPAKWQEPTRKSLKIEENLNINPVVSKRKNKISNTYEGSEEKGFEPSGVAVAGDVVIKYSCYKHSCFKQF